MSKSFLNQHHSIQTIKPIHHYSMLLEGTVKLSFRCSHCQSVWWGTCPRGESSLDLKFLNGQIWGSVNNHNVQAFYKETSQLPSSTMPVICPTVNQALKQAPLLSCPTCGVQHKARSSLYTLWCGIIWDGGGKNHFELFLSSYNPLYWSGQCVCAHDSGMFSVIVRCIRSGWPFDKAPFCDIMSI